MSEILHRGDVIIMHLYFNVRVDIPITQHNYSFNSIEGSHAVQSQINIIEVKIALIWVCINSKMYYQTWQMHELY